MPTADAYGIIWDVDGTLVDTAELHYAAWVELAKALHLPFSRADFTATFGRRNPEILRELYGGQYTDEEIADLGARKEDLYRAAARKQGVGLLPGARALLDGLHAAGFRQAIGSSAPRRNIDLILDLTGIAPLFQAITSAEDTQRGKPDPQVFTAAAAKLGIPPIHCLVLEDAVAGVQAARAGGMKCIALSFVGHHPETALHEAGANLVVHTLEEVSASSVAHLLGCTAG
jgi:beta-phosphoglucomutase